MSLFGKYISERLGHGIVENDHGFATYSFEPQGVYIRDLYVDPDHRHNKAASKLADQIILKAKERGCTKVFGSVQPSTNNSTDSLKVLLAYGFKLSSCTNDFILMEMSI